jgi:hypothetical protein
MRCDACGARNPASASWCSQCFGPLGGGGTSPPTVGGPPTLAPGPPTGTTPEGPAPSRPPPVPPPAASDRDARERDVRERDGEVEWRCAVCEGWSPLEVPACRRCGAPRTGFGVDAPGPPAGEELGRLVLLTALLPGLGHLRAGRVGTGVARAVVTVAWLLGAVALGLGALRTSSAPVAAVPLLLGAAVVWVASLRDVRRLGSGEGRELLDARGLLWLVAAVTGLLASVLLVDMMRLSAG